MVIAVNDMERIAGAVLATRPTPWGAKTAIVVKQKPGRPGGVVALVGESQPPLESLFQGVKSAAVVPVVRLR